MNQRNLWLGIASLFLVLFGAAPASAHDVLVNVDPADGEVVESAPEKVVLTFSGELIDISPQVILSTGEEQVPTDAPSIDGFDLVAPMPDLDEGTYTLAYSVVSSDGHRIEGSTTFSVGTAPATEGEGATGGDSVRGQDPADEPPDSGEESGAVSTIRILGFVMLGLGTIIIISRMLRRRQ